MRYDFPATRYIGSYDCAAAGRRLQQYFRQTLPIGRQANQMRLREYLLHVAPMSPPLDRTLGMPRLKNARRNARRIGVIRIAHKHESCGNAPLLQASGCRNKLAHSLVPEHPRREYDNRHSVGFDSWGKSIHIHSGTADHMNMAGCDAKVYKPS